MRNRDRLLFRRSAAAGAWLALALSAWPQRAGAASESKNLDEVAEAGRTLFRRVCARCHNVGSGPRAPADLKGLARGKDAAWLKERLKHQQPIPGLAVTAEQVEELLAYLSIAA